MASHEQKSLHPLRWLLKNSYQKPAKNTTPLKRVLLVLFRDFSLEAVEGDSTVNLRNASEENFEPPAPSQALSIASSVTEIESYDGNLCSPPKIDVRNSPANRDPDVDDQNSEASPRPRSRDRDNMLRMTSGGRCPKLRGHRCGRNHTKALLPRWNLGRVTFLSLRMTTFRHSIPPTDCVATMRLPRGPQASLALARRGLPSKQSPTPEYSDEEYSGMPPPPSTSKALGWGDSESRPQPHQDSSITSIQTWFLTILNFGRLDVYSAYLFRLGKRGASIRRRTTSL